jgi:hypothetical protein
MPMQSRHPQVQVLHLDFGAEAAEERLQPPSCA